MRKNIGTIILMLLICLTFILTIPSNIGDESEERTDILDNYYLDLDHDFIWNVTENMSYIVDDYPRGREFGTNGEIVAANLLQQQMNSIGLYNYNETINETWGSCDSWTSILNLTFDPWVDDLNKVRNPTNWYLNLTVKNGNDEIIEYKNLSQYDCFPFLRRNDILGRNVTWNGLEVIEKSENDDSNNNQMIMINSTWINPYSYNNSNLNDSCKGFIVINCNNESMFMGPARYVTNGNV